MKREIVLPVLFCLLAAGASAQGNSVGQHPSCDSGNSDMKLNVYERSSGESLDEAEAEDVVVDKVKDITDVVVKGCYPEEGNNAASIGVLVGYEDFPSDDDPRYYYGRRTGYTSLTSYTYHLDGSNFRCTAGSCSVEALNFRIDTDRSKYDQFTFSFEKGKDHSRSDIVYHLALVTLSEESPENNLPASLNFLTEEGQSYYCGGADKKDSARYNWDPQNYDCLASGRVHITEVLGEPGSDEGDSGGSTDGDGQQDSSGKSSVLDRINIIPKGAWLEICRRNTGAQISGSSEAALMASCITEFVVPIGTGNPGNSPISVDKVSASGLSLATVNSRTVMESFCRSAVNTRTGDVFQWDRDKGKCVETNTNWQQQHPDYASEQATEEGGSEDPEDEPNSQTPSCTESNSADCVCPEGKRKKTYPGETGPHTACEEVQNSGKSGREPGDKKDTSANSWSLIESGGPLEPVWVENSVTPLRRGM